jgi:peptide/nickel transport system substrate-binding protein
VKLTRLVALVALLGLALPAGPALAQAPAAKDTLTVAQFVDPPNLDPYNTTAPYISVFAQICEPLIYWDSDASGNAVIKKLLATDYRWLDPTRLQFKLRSGERFSNGEPFNAEAAKHSLEQLFAAFNYSQWLKDLLKEVTVVDDSTVNVVLTKPAGYVVSVLAFGSFQVAPKDFKTRGKDAFNTSPVCTGPWVFKEHKKDSHIVLTANPAYWGGTPRFKTITYRIIPDDSARLAALEAGEVDIAPNVPHSAAARVEQSQSLRLLSIPSLRQFATFFDTDNPKAKPLQDLRVRQALNLAIDRATICKQIFAGRCTPKDAQYLSKWHSGYNPGLKAYPYDPAQAKKLLADAGFASGFEVDYTYTTGRYPLDKQAGEAMASYLRAVGLKVNEQAVDFPTWARGFDANPRQTSALFTVGFLFSQDGYLAMLGFTPGKRFRTSVMPAGFDSAMDQAGKATDEAARAKAVQEAMAAASKEPFAVYLYSIDDLYGVQRWVQGFMPRPDQVIRLTSMGVVPK